MNPEIPSPIRSARSVREDWSQFTPNVSPLTPKRKTINDNAIELKSRDISPCHSLGSSVAPLKGRTERTDLTAPKDPSTAGATEKSAQSRYTNSLALSLSYQV